MNLPPIELTRSEWIVLKAIWGREPCTAPGLQEELFKATGWTYSTVRTIMDRMVAKGILQAEKLRNLTLFRANVTRAQAQRSEILYTLKHAFDGALTPMVQHLLETNEVSESDLAEIEALIKARRKFRTRGKPTKGEAK